MDNPSFGIYSPVMNEPPFKDTSIPPRIVPWDQENKDTSLTQTLLLSHWIREVPQYTKTFLPVIHPLSLFLPGPRLLHCREDGVAESLDRFLRQCLQEYPNLRSQLLREMVATLAKTPPVSQSSYQLIGTWKWLQSTHLFPYNYVTLCRQHY